MGTSAADPKFRDSSPGGVEGIPWDGWELITWDIAIGCLALSVKVCVVFAVRLGRPRLID